MGSWWPVYVPPNLQALSARHCILPAMLRSRICQSAQRQLQTVRGLHQDFLEAYSRASQTGKLSDRERAKFLKSELEAEISMLEQGHKELTVERLDKGFFTRVPSFVERIYVKDLGYELSIQTLTLGGTTAGELYNELVAFDIGMVGPMAITLLSEDFKRSLEPDRTYKRRFVSLIGEHLVNKPTASTTELIEQAKYLGLDLCRPEAALQFCLQINLEEFGRDTNVMSRFADGDGGLRVFNIYDEIVDSDGGARPVIRAATLEMSLRGYRAGNFMFQLPEES